MADWYTSSVVYAAIPVWLASHAYVGGDKVRPTAPAAGNERVFVCGIAGTSGAAEPTWVNTKGNTTTSDNGVGWTESTGNSFYGWATAHAKLANALAWGAAGDDFWVSQDHSETNAVAVTLTIPGTNASPNRVICANRAGSTPPVSADLATTGVVTLTGANNLAINGCAYVYGLTFNIGTGTTAASTNLATAAVAHDQVYEACAFKHLVTTATCTLQIISAPNGISARVRFINTVVNFNGGVTCAVKGDSGNFFWQNTANALGGTQTALTSGFNMSARPSNITLDGLDLTFVASGKSIVTSSTAAIVRLSNCKLTSGALFATPTAIGASTDVINCDSGAVNYRNERYRYQGTLTTEIIIVRSGGFSDGTTAASHKIVTTANSKRQSPFESFEMLEWIDATGSITRTWEIVNDGVTLTNADAWIEVQYLNSSASPLGAIVTTAPADLLTAGSNIATSSVTWNTTGLGSPVKQKIAVTFNPQMKGLYRAVLKVGKASQTLYLDPKPSELP